MSDTQHDSVILVDETDHPIGTAPKLLAHEQGLLHRAFSIFIAYKDEEGIEKLLLQKRAAGKYHTPNLWSNTCCSHPRPNEPTELAAIRRLKEEMGIICQLSYCGFFIYESHFDNGLSEHELDHVFYGTLETPNCLPNPNEAQAVKWVSRQDLHRSINQEPDLYTPWLLPVLEKAQPK